MAGRKRAAEDAEPRETRSSKATKIETNATKPSSSKAGGKKGAKAASTAPPASEFKKQAMPLHVNITHTPMSVSSEATDDVPAAPADPGFIGSATLVPTTFSTGSYGWKGNKRVEVELEGGEGKKVKVMLTINATVMGSKDAENGEDGVDDEEQEAMEARKTQVEELTAQEEAVLG